ncbi:MAG TPA: SMC-Scp complex subunit ScpB [Patescibacteria group bacterium]|nr:SMC-Scp complex subunit ScpB [Patescibacteria group bacterium]
MTIDAKIEAILFSTAQAMTVKKLAELTDEKTDAVQAALETLRSRLESSGSGLQLLVHGQEAELVTKPEAAEAVRQALKQEMQSELSRPSLEALAVLAYRGPLTRPELEQIRGVQSALILRNLMIRGLVEMKEDTRLGQPIYRVTTDFLKYVGADLVESLPDFERLHGNASVEQVLDELKEQKKDDGTPDQTVAV